MKGHDPELIALKQRISELESAHRAIQEQIERSKSLQKHLEERIRLVEETPSFRGMRAVGRFFSDQKRRLEQLLLRSPLRSHFLRPDLTRSLYAAWVEQERFATPPFEDLRSLGKTWDFQPYLSVLMAVHNPRREWLDDAIHSVLAQSYENWQLCVCDDASTDEWVSQHLCSLAREDKRICIAHLPAKSGFSTALNQAGNLAHGDYIGFLDQDGTLQPHALHFVVETLQSDPAEIVYSDEDYADRDLRPLRPNFKPDWSPELLLNCMYLGNFLVVSRTGIDRAGWFRSERDGAHYYDLALRMTDHGSIVRHVPKILYHRREHSGHLQGNDRGEPGADAAALRSLSDAVERRGWKARIQPGAAPNTYSVLREIEQYPSVSVIVCSRNSQLLKQCLTSLKERTLYKDYEVVVVHHTLGSDSDFSAVTAAAQCPVVPYAGQFNFSRMNNLGAAAAKGELLIFLNDDVEPIRDDWMTRMAAHLANQGTGIVGACLLYPSGIIQHAGVVVPMSEGAGHVGRGMAWHECDFWPWLSLPRNVTAVTGACLGIRKAVFHSLGGMDTGFPNTYNDVDLCLRSARQGLNTVYEPRALLRHRECASRATGNSFGERELFHARWRGLLRSPDPYYSPSLRTDTEAVLLRFPDDTSAVRQRPAGSLS